MTLARLLAPLKSDFRPAITWLVRGLTSRTFQEARVLTVYGRKVLKCQSDGNELRVSFGDKTARYSLQAPVPTQATSLASLARRNPVMFQAPDDLILSRDFVLPEAAAKNISSAAQYALIQWTPFSPNEVYYTASISGRQPGKIKLSIYFAYAKSLDGVIDKLRSVGFSPDYIAFRKELPWVQIKSDKMSKIRRWVRFDRYLFASILASAFLLLLISWIQLGWRQSFLSTQLDQIISDSRKAQLLSSDISTMQRLLAFADEQRTSHPYLSSIMGELSSAQPAEAEVLAMTWLSSSGQLTLSLPPESSATLQLMPGSQLRVRRLQNDRTSSEKLQQVWDLTYGQAE